MKILKDEIRSSIELAAIREFTMKGFNGASIREIAKTAGVSKSNIYNYFENKEALFEYICEPAYRKLNTVLETFISHEENESLGSDEQIEKLVLQASDVFVSLISKHSRQLIIIFDKSRGTRYADVKNELIGLLENHFTKKQHPEKQNEHTLFVMHIIATNLAEAFLETLRHNQQPEHAREILKKYLEFHLKGISVFYKTG